VGVAVQRTDALGEALGLLSLWHVAQALRAALADESIGGILMDVDSPGGSVYGVMELADEIYRCRTRKPIFAVANSLAAAGAYWIASAANELYVTPGGEVGGIGVYDIHTDLSKGLEKAGVATTLISAGKYKTEGNPFQPLGADAREEMQHRVDGYYRNFVAAVAKHRNALEADVRSGMGQGRLLNAEGAKRERMADGVATFDEVLDRLIWSAEADLGVPGTARGRMPPRINGAAKPRRRGNTSPSAMSVCACQRDIDLVAL